MRITSGGAPWPGTTYVALSRITELGRKRKDAPPAPDGKCPSPTAWRHCILTWPERWTPTSTVGPPQRTWWLAVTCRPHGDARSTRSTFGTPRPITGRPKQTPPDVRIAQVSRSSRRKAWPPSTLTSQPSGTQRETEVCVLTSSLRPQTTKRVGFARTVTAGTPGSITGSGMEWAADTRHAT